MPKVFVILAVVIGWSSAVFAGPVRIYGGNFDLPLLDPIGPGGVMTEALIEVADHFTILDLDVRISLKHTEVFDLQLYLQSPAGTRRCLNMYNPYNEYFRGEDYTQTIFDDEAETPIERGRPPFTGRFKPRDIDPLNRLSAFDSQDTYGPWRLQIIDMWPTNTGTLNSVELIITVPEPATAIFLLLGTGLLTIFRPRPTVMHRRDFTAKGFPFAR